jgi:hypothetical protein
MGCSPWFIMAVGKIWSVVGCSLDDELKNISSRKSLFSKNFV